MNSPPSSPRVAFHSVLRDSTRSEHEAIDGLLSRLDLSTAHSYRAFLKIHYAALRSLAGAWRPEDRQEFGNLLDLLRTDIAALGTDVDKQISPLDSALTPANQLGVAYVIRGSRLGSKVLSRRVPPHLASSYLNYEPAVSWPIFLQELEKHAANALSGSHAQIIDGARLGFQAFDNAAATEDRKNSQISG